MPGTRNADDELFDDLAAEEERLVAEEQAEYEAAEAEEEAAEGTDGAGTVSMFEIIEKQQTETAELKDKLLRMAAEMENLRARTQREVVDARAYATTGFARDLLSVGDNLQRAIQAVPEEKRASGSDEFKALIEGVEMTEREMLNVFDRHGVRKINPLGEKFDPHFHQAMMEIPNPEVPNNSVAQVIQEGYVIGDRVLRPAMVGVAKGGPKMEEVSEEPPRETEDGASEQPVEG